MKKRILFTICLFLFCLGFGAVHFAGEYFLEELQPSQTEKYIPPDSTVHLEGEVYRKEAREDYQILYLKNNSIIYNRPFKNNSLQESKILLYDPQKTAIKTGNKVQASGNLFFFDEARNPGGFDQKFYYQKQNIHAAIWGKEVRVTDQKVSFLQDKLEQFRDKWKASLYKAAGEEDGGILAAMIIGDKAGMDAEIKELYQVNGIAHILAISGLHLSFIGTGVYQFLRKQTGSYLAGGVAGMMFLLLYVMMIGLTVSALRALVMFLIRVGADMSGRAYDMLTSLLAAAVIVVLWQPLSYYDGGFQMSFGAILGIWIAGQVQRKAEKEREKGKNSRRESGRLAGKWKSSLMASLGVQAVLLPITLYHFFSYPLYSVFLNLLVIPLMSLLLVLGAGGSLLYWVFPQGGGVLIWICKRILDLYEISCRAVMRIPASEIAVGRPELETVIFYYGTVAVALWIFFKHVGRRKWGSLLCVFTACGTLMLAGQVSVYGKTYITVLDVGQGDSIFMRGAKGTTVLVDAGSSTEKQIGKYRIEPFLKSQGVGQLDYVFVTHGDSDHMNGIEEMLSRQGRGVEISCLIFPAREMWDEKLEALAALAEQYEVKIRTVERGQGIISGEWRITCIQPEGKDKFEKGNEASLVLDVSLGKFDLLLTGDVEGEGEKILEERTGKSYDVLKVSHHGSKNSTSAEFLEEVSPDYALISAGENNRYGHPHPDTVERLEDRGCSIYTTIKNGAVTICTDGRKMEIQSFLQE